MPELLFQPIVSSKLVTLLIGVLGGLLIAGFFLTKTSWPKRVVLLALRGAAIAVLFFVMVRPTLLYKSSDKISATLVVLGDQSRSMLQNTGLSGSKSRWDTMLEETARCQPEFETLAKDLNIKLYTFDSSVQERSWKDGKFQWPDKPTGDGSATGVALEEVVRQNLDSLKAVFLLTDAAHWDLPDQDLPPQIPAARMAELGIPLYCVPLAVPQGMGQSSDIALMEMTTSPSVYVKNPLQVAGSVRVEGYVNKLITVQLLAEVAGEMKIVDAKQIQIKEDGAQEKYVLSYLPETPGETRITVRAVPQPNELVQTNNESTTYVTVLKGGVNVLYVEGALRTEQKYLRWSLSASPNINLEYRELDATFSRPLPTDIEDWFEPGRYDVFILGDVDSLAFGLSEDSSNKRLGALRERVKEGAGLMMTGGLHSFGAGGYQSTWLYLNKNRPDSSPYGFEISPVLPVTMDRTERQTRGQKPVSDLHLAGPQKMVPTTQGERHYLMLLASPNQNADVWSKLPALEGANRFRGAPGLATVLARNPQGAPLLVTHNWGSGRVIAFAGDSTWRWWMRGYENEHRRFWRQMILYLAHKEADDDAGVWVKLPRRRFTPNSRIDLTAGIQAADGQPVANAQLKAEVVFPDGHRRSLTMFRQTLDFTGSFTDLPKPAGEYSIEVSATQDGKELGRARARFVVEDHDLELANSSPIPGLLASLSTKTSGRVVPPEQLRDALRELAKEDLNLEIETQNRVELWDNWPVLLLFVGFLCVEWFFRKQWGLV